MRYVHGIDGKHYPRPLRSEDRDYLIGRAHYLHHDEQLSIRGIAQRLHAETGLSRSVGSIAAYLRIPCIECSGGPSATPEQVEAVS